MPQYDRTKAAAALADLSPDEALALIAAERQRKAQADEDAKPHPLRDLTLPPAKWIALRDHIRDGGGVADDRDLSRDLLQALLDGDQDKFWPLLVHLVKSRAKIHGHARPLKSGGVSFTGIDAGRGK